MTVEDSRMQIVYFIMISPGKYHCTLSNAHDWFSTSIQSTQGTVQHDMEAFTILNFME